MASTDSEPTAEQLDGHLLDRPIAFYVGVGVGDRWKLHKVGGAAYVMEAIYLWLREHNPSTLKVGMTLYAALGADAPSWEALPDGGRLEFEVVDAERRCSAWTAVLMGLANAQWAETSVGAAALCIRETRIRVELWLRNCDDAAVAAKRLRELLLAEGVVPTTVEFNSFRRLKNQRKKPLLVL